MLRTLRRMEQEALEHDNYIVLTNWDSLLRLEKYLDQEVVILASVSQIRLGDKGPTIVMLGRKRNGDFPLIFFDKDVFLSSKISRYKGEFVRVRGIVKKYRNEYANVDELQIVVTLPSQITADENAPNYSGE